MLHSFGTYFTASGKMGPRGGPRFSRQPRGKRPLRVIWSRPATLEPLGAEPLGCRSAAALVKFDRQGQSCNLYVDFGCEAASLDPKWLQELSAHLSRTVGLPGGMGFAPGPRGATDPPQISQHKLFEFTRFNFILKIA